MDSENGNKILGIRIPFSSAVSFGEISNSARRRNSNQNSKIIVSGIIPFFFFCGHAKF
jgi:hypothetical protein